VHFKWPFLYKTAVLCALLDADADSIVDGQLLVTSNSIDHSLPVNPGSLDEVNQLGHQETNLQVTGNVLYVV